MSMTAFDIITLSCGQQGSGSSYMTMCGRRQHYLSKNFCQYIKSLYCHTYHILQISHLAFLLTPITETGTERPSLCWHSVHSDGRDKTAVHHSRKCFLGLLQRPSETLEVVHWYRRKLFQRRSLAPECKCTMLIFILLVSELSWHRLYMIFA